MSQSTLLRLNWRNLSYSWSQKRKTILDRLLSHIATLPTRGRRAWLAPSRGLSIRPAQGVRPPSTDEDGWRFLFNHDAQCYRQEIKQRPAKHDSDPPQLKFHERKRWIILEITWDFCRRKKGLDGFLVLSWSFWLFQWKYFCTNLCCLCKTSLKRETESVQVWQKQTRGSQHPIPQSTPFFAGGFRFLCARLLWPKSVTFQRADIPFLAPNLCCPQEKCRWRQEATLNVWLPCRLIPQICGTYLQDTMRFLVLLQCLSH